MIILPGFQERFDAYERMDKQPFTLRLKLRQGQQLAGYDPVSISGLLGWCAMMELTDGKGVPQSDEPYLIPAPIHCLWRDAQGLPLWECTPLTHQGTWATDVAYRHKKRQSGRFTKGRKFKGRMYFNISPSDGRFMERRVPVPTMIAEAWECQLVANVEEVARLLGYVYAVGKEHNRGFGIVDRWEGEPCGAVPLVEDWRLTRAIPIDAEHVLGEYEPEESPSWGSWTDPGWVRGAWAQRWRAGTRCVGPTLAGGYAGAAARQPIYGGIEPMLGGVVRAIRLLCILQDLQERPRTAGELADRYGVSARTIRRDLVVLQAEPMYASLYKEGSFWCYLK